MLGRRARQEDAAGGAALDAAAAAAVGSLGSLSELSAPAALSYIERILRASPGLTTASGIYLTSLGYGAHLALEADGAPWGVTELPVVATLPERAPSDLVLRLVKLSRRAWPALRAVEAPTWEGFVSARTAACDPPLLRELVDGLLRFGWLLRQADIHYGLDPEGA